MIYGSTIVCNPSRGALHHLNSSFSFFAALCFWACRTARRGPTGRLYWFTSFYRGLSILVDLDPINLTETALRGIC